MCEHVTLQSDPQIEHVTQGSYITVIHFSHLYEKNNMKALKRDITKQ